MSSRKNMWLWSWFLNKCLLVYQFLLIKYKGLRFDYDAIYAIKQKRNRQTLYNILKQNKNTKFLIDQCKKAQLDTIENIENFK
jgi:hypothetical protein